MALQSTSPVAGTEGVHTELVPSVRSSKYIIIYCRVDDMMHGANDNVAESISILSVWLGHRCPDHTYKQPFSKIAAVVNSSSMSWKSRLQVSVLPHCHTAPAKRAMAWYRVQSEHNLFLVC